MSATGLMVFFRRSFLHLESRILQAIGFNNRAVVPALAVQGPGIFPQPHRNEETEEHSFLDNIFWMAAPKKRRTIEINRCRRRNPQKLIQTKTNIEPCSECGNLKQKHVLCGFCYEKVRRETAIIRGQIQAQEGKPLNNPAVETVVLYEGEMPADTDAGKRIVERKRQRPSWFTQY
ncbi:39S ribosomal protein L32 [Huso huso]|uniref:Large ribosomal subunit protein bL32m n=1 Tax=Huso huso TaxID=61971 RepID=A0ABR1A1B7_HUSHU